MGRVARGEFPSKAEQRTSGFVGNRRRGVLLKALEPPSRREENGKEIC